MKSFGLVAPLLAGTAAARAMLDARALIGVDGSGAVCPMARSDTVLVTPIFYSEFIPYNTIIDPFRNGRPVTVNNAPTPIIILSDIRTTILGDSVTIPPSHTVTTPATTPSGSVTLPRPRLLLRPQPLQDSSWALVSLAVASTTAPTRQTS